MNGASGLRLEIMMIFLGDAVGCRRGCFEWTGREDFYEVYRATGLVGFRLRKLK